MEESKRRSPSSADMLIISNLLYSRGSTAAADYSKSHFLTRHKCNYISLLRRQHLNLPHAPIKLKDAWSAYVCLI